MSEILKNIRPEIKTIAEKYGVTHLYAIGPTINADFDKIQSIDILVSFKEEKEDDQSEGTDYYFSLQEDLENLFNKKVDLIVDKSLNNPYFSKMAVKSRLILFE